MASAWSQLDQLLTCAICLDRYRNPKLLPCQHTFCMEPCLDGLIDYARRQIKCPECRAEHRIPYQGIQQFPTNVTLMRFLELHRDITGEEPEPPPSMMERCNVCSEKSNVERCAHCDKKICPDCKEAHVDILRREINRINNQVRRGLHRLSEALTQTKKNAEKLQTNCNQVKEEIDDIVKRYSKDLKVTEERLKHDLELYTEKEMKFITKLKEDLEIEVNNISSNCELVDKYIKDDFEWSDTELLEYKQIFLKMLDFLRTFDSDNSDFSRRIKFQPRADPDVLHKNIADFGELKINAPMNPLPTQQSLMPSNALMRSQSDHRLAAQFAKRCDNRSFSDINQRLDSDGGRPTSPILSRSRRETDGYRKYSERSKDFDYQDRSSSRYCRDESSLSSRWRENDEHSNRNRYPRDYEDNDSEPHQSRTVRFADEPQQRERLLETDIGAKGPLSGVIKLLDVPKVMERLHQNEVKQKHQHSEKEKTPPLQTSTPTISPASPQPKRQTSRQQSEDDVDRQKRENQQASSSTTSTPDPTSLGSSHRGSVTEPQRNTTVSFKEPPQVSDGRESTESFLSRRRLSGTSSFDEPTSETTRNLSRQVSKSNIDLDKEIEVGNSKELVGLRDIYTPRRYAYTRHRSDTRYDRLTPIFTEDDTKEDTERDSLLSSRSTTPTRRFTVDGTTGQERPNYYRFRNNEVSRVSSPTDGTRSPTSRYSPLCRRTFALSTISSLEPTSNDDSCCSSDSSANIFFSCNTSLEDISDANTQTSGHGYSRSPLVKTQSLDAGESSRKPLDKKIQPRAATPVHQIEDEDESEESEEEDSESEDEQPPKEQLKPVQSSFFSRQRRLPDPEPRLLEMHETENEDESESEEESEEEESPAQATGTKVENSTETEDEETESSSSESEVDESPEPANNTMNNSDSLTEKLGVTSRNVKQINSKNEISDTSENESENGTRTNAKESDDEEEDGYNSKLPMNSTLTSRTSYDTPSTGEKRSRKRSDDTDTTDSSSASSPTSTHRRTGSSVTPADARLEHTNSHSTGGRFRRRPFLARSKSSHEIGIGSNTLPDDDDEDVDDEPEPALTYRSRGQRLAEDISRRRSSTTESPTSTSSNSCWAKYLNNKYGNNASSRAVPRSKSSHSLYQKSDSESEEKDERETVMPGSYGFGNPRSNYMQKRRLLHKIGSRGSEPGNFIWPRGVAVGPDNSIVVADSSNHRVQVFDSIGKFLFEFGTYGSGDGNFDCLAGVSVNRIGQFIVSDRYNNRIQLFDPTGRFLRAFGCEGRTDGRFTYPWGIATDSLGFIYVCDKENHRIQVFQSDGTFVGKFGGVGSRPGQLEQPHYVAVTNTNRVVVTDTNNHRVQIFDVNGRSLTTFGSEGSDSGHFKFPKGVAVDDQGFIIVGDSGNNRIQIFQPDGTFLKCFGSWGSGDGEFKGLEGLAVTTGGSIIACDRENHSIQVF